MKEIYDEAFIEYEAAHSVGFVDTGRYIAYRGSINSK